jgi:hypothetical protein
MHMWQCQRRVQHQSRQSAPRIHLHAENQWRREREIPLASRHLTHTIGLGSHGLGAIVMGMP